MKSQWINLEKRMPPMDVPVIICVKCSHKSEIYYQIRVASRVDDISWIDCNDQKIEFYKGYVYAWMWLPDNPDEEIKVIQKGEELDEHKLGIGHFLNSGII